MKTKNLFYKKDEVFEIPRLDSSLENLAIVFGPQESFYSSLSKKIKEINPNIKIVGMSSTQSFCDSKTLIKDMAVAYLSFEKTKIKTFILPNESYSTSEQTGTNLVNKLKSQESPDYPLCGVMILAEGLKINGAGLVRTFKDLNIPVFGGLASEPELIFDYTHVFYEHTELPNHVIAVGFYGNNLKIQSLNSTGLKPIGVYKKITESFENTLIKVDNMSAFDWYRSFLKNKNVEYANSLAYPIAIFKEEGEIDGAARTPIAFDQTKGKITFTGEIPKDYWLKLMIASPYELISQAEDMIDENNKKNKPDFSLYFSCASRKLFLNHLTDLEYQKAKNCIGSYVYGEISSIKDTPTLLNQTLTIINLKEVI